MKIKVLCIDIDGTLMIDGRLYHNVVNTLEELKNKYEIVFVSNTTSVPFTKLSDELKKKGIEHELEDLYTPVRAAREIMTKRGHDKGMLIAPEDIRDDLSWFKEDEKGSSLLIAHECLDMVVEDLQKYFRFLLKTDSNLYTLQKNRFYKKEGELVFDMGPVVSLLEYASNKKAKILGKPGEELFDSICERFNAKRNELLMIGDDVEFDVLLSQKIGVNGLLVKTGKFLEHVYNEVVDRYSLYPDYEVDSFQDLKQILLD